MKSEDKRRKKHDDLDADFVGHKLAWHLGAMTNKRKPHRKRQGVKRDS